MEIDGEQAYPIYSFSLKWHQAGESEYPTWKIGLPEGRIWNSNGFDKMFREEQPERELDLFLIEWWKKYLSNKFKGRIREISPSVPILNWKLQGHETWTLTWFQHETFDTGQSDIEAISSFEKFVRRKQRLNNESRSKGGEDVYCLMGAEDRWRWAGAEPLGNSEARSEPPCRCKHCKKLGLLRIGH